MKKLIQIFAISILFSCSKQTEPTPIVIKSDLPNIPINWVYNGNPTDIKRVYTTSDSLFVELNYPDINKETTFGFLFLQDCVLYFKFKDEMGILSVNRKL